jgi:hypothetical protein
MPTYCDRFFSQDHHKQGFEKVITSFSYGPGASLQIVFKRHAILRDSSMLLCPGPTLALLETASFEVVAIDLRSNGIKVGVILRDDCRYGVRALSCRWGMLRLPTKPAPSVDAIFALKHFQEDLEAAQLTTWLRHCAWCRMLFLLRTSR